MKKPHILAIDCGTQSIRALLFDERGNIIGKEKQEFEPYFSLQPGWAEQDPEVYWKGLITVCNLLKEKEPEHWENIIGVTVTTQRDTGILVDKGGTPQRPAITWLDQRMAKGKSSLKLHHQVAVSLVGMQRAMEVTRKKSKANWIKENEPEIWKKTYKYLLLSGFLTYKLTGRMVDSVASQIGHIPFDYKNKCWYKSDLNMKWGLFGIERDKLPELVEPGDTVGKITEEAARHTGIKEGTPFIAAGSDKGCETIGMGCVDPSSASISFGTTATIQTTTKKYIELLRFMPSYPSVIKDCYNPELEIFRGYWMISWFKKEFGMRELVEARERGISPEVLLNERLNEIPAGSQGLILQPYWGPGLKMPEAKGAILGFGDVHTRAHIYRAIIEGINYALMEGLERMEKKTGTRVKRLFVSGGGSQSEAICQITADMFNLPVYKGSTHETSGLGAAIAGFTGAGVYSSISEAVENMVTYSEEFLPREEYARIYKELYQKVYKKIYQRIKILYDEIQKITNYPEF